MSFHLVFCLFLAEEFLGWETSFLGLGGIAAGAKKSASGVGSTFKLIGAGFSAATHGAKAMQQAEDLQKAQLEKGTKNGEDAGATSTSNTNADTSSDKEKGSDKTETQEFKMDAEAEAKLSETFDASLPAFLNVSSFTACSKMSTSSFMFSSARLLSFLL